MSKDGPRLSRLGVLAPAALSVCIDASVLAAPAAGAVLTTVLKELSKAFMLKKWFHGVMSAQDAEHLLMLKGKHGSYLVRESQTHPGEFVLSVRVKNRVSHIMILRERKKYHVGSGESFDDLTGLIEHCRAYPITETSGDTVRLLQPVNESKAKAMLGGAKKIELQRIELEDIQSVLPYDDEDNMADLRDMDLTMGPYVGSNGFYGDFVGGGLSAEFRCLKNEQSRHTFTQIVGNLRENRHKNRYNNVIPYDQTRVLIPRDMFTSDDHQFSDYINASYIRPAPLLAMTRTSSSISSAVTSMESFYSGELGSVTEPLETMMSQPASEVVKDKYYIATQGCLWTTVQTFWQMIVSNDVRVIAMIAKKYENHKKKCERYWPLVGERERYGDITVETVREYHVQAYVIREFEVSMEGKKLTTVYHFQFKIWPDQHTPTDTAALLRFQNDINHRMLLIANSNNPPEQNILCVHCSAGIGRTGTFIALDMLIDQVKTEGLDTHIDIYATVKLCRYQRPGMVRNKAQYKFLYQTMRQYLDEARVKADNRVL